MPVIHDRIIVSPLKCQAQSRRCSCLWLLLLLLVRSLTIASLVVNVARSSLESTGRIELSKLVTETWPRSCCCQSYGISSCGKWAHSVSWRARRASRGHHGPDKSFKVCRISMSSWSRFLWNILTCLGMAVLQSHVRGRAEVCGQHPYREERLKRWPG